MERYVYGSKSLATGGLFTDSSQTKATGLFGGFLERWTLLRQGRCAAWSKPSQWQGTGNAARKFNRLGGLI